MSMPAHSSRILPMRTAGTEHLIERTYREGGTFQWVRETYQNAGEANATHIEFGIEWQAVESQSVYRRLIADNGDGMTAAQLEEFFNTFGGGGKPIGGLHENFGVGCKTSLLPWNRYGVVVISWVDGDASMIWIQQDEETGEYGLRLVEAYDPDTGQMSIESVCTPYDDPDHGCDWSLIKPDWISDHGTVIVLLGNDPSDDTVVGDPNRAEGDIKGISSYLNRRLWELPKDCEVYVDELRTQDRSRWPTSEDLARGRQPAVGYDPRTNHRQILGARYFVEYPDWRGGENKLADNGTVRMPDDVEVDWFLWEGNRPHVQSYAAISGYIGTLYKNELYDVTAHPSHYRSFGITEGSVRNRLWLVIRPALLGDDGKYGVYPRGDRNGLLLKGGPNAGGPLPIADWGAQFSEAMPDAIRNALRSARVGQNGTLADKAWRERLADRFGSRWRIIKFRARPNGDVSVSPAQPGTKSVKQNTAAPRTRPRVVKPHSGGRGGRPAVGDRPGPVPAAKSSVAGGIPDYELVSADAIEAGMLAAWQPNHPDHPSGVVLINAQHPVIEQIVRYWQDQYADHLSDKIEEDVHQIYGEVAVAKIAHSEHLKTILASPVIDQQLRTPGALTLALLGLMSEEALIAPRLGGKYAKRRSS
jgi:hypothetical protein